MLCALCMFMLKKIIKIIVFFDIFDYPLTAKEIWQNINLECSLQNIENILSSSNIKQLSHKDGFYFLRNRDEIIQTRLKRINFAQRKIKLTKKIVQLFKFIPWIRMVAIGNMIGANNLRDNSDIDLFIITDAKRIWLARFFCVGIAQILGVRPHKNNTRDKICLSFFVSTESLNLKKLMLKNIQKDLYFTYWLAGLMPIYDTDNTYAKFTQANSWIENYLPNWQAQNYKQSKKIKLYKNILDFYIGRFESSFKKFQLKIMPQNLKKLMNKDTKVVVSDSILKLHVDDRRFDFYEKYNNKIQNISL